MSPFTRLYYAVKPFLPRSIRVGLRRVHARRARSRAVYNWPIQRGSERPPQGWTGWPDCKKFAVVLTHDVEGQKGYDRILQLAALEKELGFRSSFNLIPEGPYSVTPELRARLAAEGFEVGIHDLNHDGKLYRSPEEFSRRAKKINHYVKEWGVSGFRSAYMHHNLEWLGELNVAYDTSTFDTDPFEPQPDGVGTIFPFWVPRSPSANGKPETRNPKPETGGPPGFIELPYTLVQDSTLFLFLGEKTIDVWKQKVDWIAEHGGMVLVNVHPDYVNFGDRLGGHDFPVALYRELLGYLRERYAGQYWAALPRQVAAFARPVAQIAAAGAARVPVGPVEAPRLVAVNQSPAAGFPQTEEGRPLAGRRAAVVLFSSYPSDPRPRRSAEALRDAGMEVDILCLRENEEEPRWEENDSIRVRRLSITRRRGGKLVYLWQYASFILSASVWLTWRTIRRRYDLVHVHNMPDVLVFSALIPKLFGARVLLDLHDPMPELMMTIFGLNAQSRGVRILKRLEKWSMAFANHVVTVNLACKKIFAARSCASGKIQVIMNSPDERFFGRTPPSPRAVGRRDPARPYIIMCHGSILERHGIDLAVMAIRQLGAAIPRVELRIYGGKTPFVDKVLALARREGVENRVRYLGGMSIEKIVAAIDEADLGIIPNRRSIFTELNTPTRIFEYLSRGVPVIAPRAPGIQDYFAEQDMLYFELGDAGDLVRQIQYAFDHPREVADIVQRGQVIYRNHQWHEERQRLVDLVGSLVAPIAPR